MKILIKRKPNQWLTVVVIVLSFYHNGAGEILNAYENDIKLMRISIKNIETLISDQHASNGVKNRLLKMLNDLKIKEAAMRVYYLKTDDALAKLKAIDPSLFDSVNQIKDKKGNVTHIYVKIIPEDTRDPESTMAGLSFVTPSKEDADISSTKYGKHTAYVEVKDLPHKSFCYSDVFLLAHEFGHLIYEIPNLADYSRFYRATYNRSSQLMGHHWSDPSGKSVEKIIKSFLQLYRDYKNELERQEPSFVANAS